MRIAVVGLLFLLPACLGAAKPQSVCPPIPQADVEVAAEGDRTNLRAVVLWADRTVRAQRVCPEFSVKETLVGPIGGAVRGHIDAQDYEELRLIFSDGVARVLIDVPARQNGRLLLTFDGDVLRARWNGHDVAVETGEWFSDPHALDGFHYEEEGDFVAAPLNFTIQVNTSWNRGLQVLGGVSGPEEADARLPHMEARLLDANGTVIAQDVANWIEDGLFLKQAPLDQGTWYIEVDRTLGPGDWPVINYLSIDFDY